MVYHLIQHTNPDDSAPPNNLKVLDPDNADFCGVVIRDNVTIGRNVRIHPGAVLNHGSAVGSGCFLGPKVVLDARTALPPNSKILRAAVIRTGQHLHGETKFYHWDAYLAKDGTKTFRHGCRTMPLRAWTASRQAKLCALYHHPSWQVNSYKEVLRELARAVRTAREFLRGIR